MNGYELLSRIAYIHGFVHNFFFIELLLVVFMFNILK